MVAETQQTQDLANPDAHPVWPARPPGPLVWFNVPNESELGPVEELAARLEQADPDISILITTASLPADPERGAVTFVPLLGDKRSEVQSFLNHWSPDICLWTRGELRPNALVELEDRGVPIFLIDATVPDFPRSRVPWGRLRQKSMLRRFDRILAADEEAAARLKSLGARPWIVEETGALEEGSITLPASEAERSALAEELATRPIWYAVDLPVSELTLVLKAHNEALRRAHRFLLVLGTNQESDIGRIVGNVKEAGLRAALRSETDEIDSELQVLIADLPDEQGLWYRLAPRSYIGGTFSDEPNRNPFEAAALGSAIIHGPRIHNFKAHFARLQTAGGARSLQTPGVLGRAVADLSSPERCADLAHAAWDVSSSGANVTDRVIGLIRDALDKRARGR